MRAMSYKLHLKTTAADSSIEFTAVEMEEGK
jgi:hypothetical protein